jgi:flagellum-specific peptidoglycan hydrolase FlgJ
MKTITDKWYILPLILIVLMLVGKAQAQDTLQVKALLEAYGVKHVDIVVRQSVVETGWYKCTNCSLDNNNLFGFISSKGGYMKFDTWQDSVKEYAVWQKRFYKGGDYHVFLKRIGYAEDPNYINKLKTVY